MKILNMRNLTGRNIFSHKPVTRMVVDLEDYAGKTTLDFEDFNERVLAWFPGLKGHFCSPGHEGGFVERMYEGTYLSHVTEHLALELQCLMGYDVYFGKTRVIEEPSVYSIIYEYLNEHCAMEFGKTAVEIISALAENEIPAVDELLGRLRHLARESDLGPSTKAILDEAIRRHIPVRRLGQDSLLQLGYGKYSRFLESSLTDTISCVAVDLAQNKQVVKDLLKEQGIPVPEGGVADTEDDAVYLASRLGYPVVIKPYDGNHGKGISSNIRDEGRVREAYRLARSYSYRVIVERMIRGFDYRVLVIGDRVAAVAQRKPPHVIGDGLCSISELVDRENAKSCRGWGHEKPLSHIVLDPTALDLLDRSGWNQDSIPAPGEIVYLRENGNLSTGGSARDCTDEIHPANKALAVQAARTIGLDVAGIDLVMDDISRELTQSNGAVIEVNAAPGLRMHLYPSEGKSRNVAADIIDFIYPAGTPYSIPIVSVTGTNGKTTVTRMIKHVLDLTGARVGMTCTSGTYIGQECISRGDNTGPVSARSVLYHRGVEAAVLETARGGIVRKGLGYDLADVGIITNISEDHLGIDGIETLQDLAFTKSLVVEAVKPGGYAVLNADDSRVRSLSESLSCNLVYFSQNPLNPWINQHINQGGLALVLEQDLILVYRNQVGKSLLSINEVPLTFSGKATCNVENTLAAAACLYALGVAPPTIRQGLRSFSPDPLLNAGRFNLFDLGSCQVLLDYGHNPSGFQSVVDFSHKLNPTRMVGVIGMPGDRLDNMIVQIGIIAGSAFDRLYIKEDRDLRGRRSGEVAELLYQGAIAGGLSANDITVILPEIEALQAALDNAHPGDLIVMFYELFEPALQMVEKIQGESQSLPMLLDQASFALLPAIETDEQQPVNHTRSGH